MVDEQFERIMKVIKLQDELIALQDKKIELLDARVSSLANIIIKSCKDVVL